MNLVQRYSLLHWTLTRHTGDAIEYRPGFRITLRRLTWSMAALLGMLAVHLAYTQIVGPALPTVPAEMDDVSADPMGSAVRVRQIASAAHASLMALCLFVALVAPLSTLIERLHISRDMRGNLVVAHQRILSKRRQWPRGAFQSINTYYSERLSRSRGVDWRHWRVGLSPREGIPAMLEFDLASVSTKEVPGPTPPREVVELVQHLKRLTGLPAHEPVHADFPQMRRRSLLPKVSISIGPSVREWKSSATFGSLDEIPEEMRPKAAALIAEARAKAADRGWSSGTYTASTFQITDDQGVTRTYNSFDELPEDVQARLRQLRQGENRDQ